MHFTATSFLIGATLGKRHIPNIPSLRKQFNIIAVYLGVSLKFLKAAALHSISIGIGTVKFQVVSAYI